MFPGVTRSNKVLSGVTRSFSVVYSILYTHFTGDWETDQNYSHGTVNDEMEKYIKAQEKK